MAKKEITWENGYFPFLKKHIPHVYLPMLIWSIPLMVAAIIRGGNMLHSILWMAIGGYSVYYFIALIVQYYLLLPFLIKFGKTAKGLIVSITISAVSMLVLFYLTVIQGYEPSLIIYAGPFFVWIMFFVMGIYLQFNKTFISGGILIFLCIFFLMLSFLENKLQMSVSNKFIGFGQKITAFGFGYFVILFLFSLKDRFTIDNKFSKFILYLGNISFGVYLIHLYVLGKVAKPIIHKATLVSNNFFIEQLLLTMTTLFGCISIIEIGKKIDKKTASKYLGF